MTYVARPISEPIDLDHPCRHCGYNLRGLLPLQPCPECGQEIRIVNHADLLRFADPKWLGRLHFGVALAMWSVGLAIVNPITKTVLGALGLPVFLMLGAGMIPAGVALWAVVNITVREPRSALQKKTLSLCNVLRITAGAGFLGSVLVGCAQGWVSRLSVASWMGACGAVLNYGILLATFSLLVYLRRIANRIPDDRIVRATTRFIWLTSIAVVFGVSLIATAWTLQASGVMGPTTSSRRGGDFALVVSASVTSPSPAPGAGTGTVTVVTPAGTTYANPPSNIDSYFFLGVCSLGIARFVVHVLLLILLGSFRGAIGLVFWHAKQMQTAPNASTRAIEVDDH